VLVLQVDAGVAVYFEFVLVNQPRANICLGVSA
jgi:hypothetical protein